MNKKECIDQVVADTNKLTKKLLKALDGEFDGIILGSLFNIIMGVYTRGNDALKQAIIKDFTLFIIRANENKKDFVH